MPESPNTTHDTIGRAKSQEHLEATNATRNKAHVDAWKSSDGKVHYSGTPTKGSTVTSSTDSQGKKHYSK